jgi:hypothetical protein
MLCKTAHVIEPGERMKKNEMLSVQGENGEKFINVAINNCHECIKRVCENSFDKR